MAIAIAWPGFNDLQRSMTPIFLLMDHFLYQFPYFREKYKENLSIRSLNFSQNTTANSGLFSSSFICAGVSNASWRVKFCENVGNIGIIYPIHPFLQNKTKIVCLHWPTFDNFNYKPLYIILNCDRQFFKIMVVFHTLYLWSEVADPPFFVISDTTNSLSDCSKYLKKTFRLVNLR